MVTQLKKVQVFQFRHYGLDPESSEFNAFARTLILGQARNDAFLHGHHP